MVEVKSEHGDVRVNLRGSAEEICAEVIIAIKGMYGAVSTQSDSVADVLRAGITAQVFSGEIFKREGDETVVIKDLVS